MRIRAGDPSGAQVVHGHSADTYNPCYQGEVSDPCWPACHTPGPSFPPPQSTVEHLQQTLDSKTAELTRLTMKLEEASASADHTQQALQGQVAELGAGRAAAEAAKGAMEARIGGLEGRLQQLIDASAAKEAELGAELEAANAARQASSRELASVNMRLEIVTQEAAAKVGWAAGCRAGRGGGGGACIASHA